MIILDGLLFGFFLSLVFSIMMYENMISGFSIFGIMILIPIIILKDLLTQTLSEGELKDIIFWYATSLAFWTPICISFFLFTLQ